MFKNKTNDKTLYLHGKHTAYTYLFVAGHKLLGDRLGSADTNFGSGVKRSEVRGRVPNWWLSFRLLWQILSLPHPSRRKFTYRWQMRQTGSLLLNLKARATRTLIKDLIM